MCLEAIFKNNFLFLKMKKLNTKTFLAIKKRKIGVYLGMSFKMVLENNSKIFSEIKVYL